jgi:hypothetical protein
MKKVFAFGVLIVFVVLVLAGCLLFVIIPQTLADIGLQSASDANPLSRNLPVIYLALGVVCFAAAYGGSYLLVRYKVNGYLSKGVGYSKIVALGFILQIVLCLFFLLALLGGLKGSAVANIMVIILLVAPFVIRQVYLKMRPDRTFDNFLLENDVEEKDEVNG